MGLSLVLKLYYSDLGEVYHHVFFFCMSVYIHSNVSICVYVCVSVRGFLLVCMTDVDIKYLPQSLSLWWFELEWSYRPKYWLF